MADPLARFLPTSDVLDRSVLDRLIDVDPSAPRDRPQPIGEQLSAVREALRRDLEALMNTRCRHETPPDALDGTLLSYGVESLFAVNLVTREQRAALATALERRLRTFEPRFATVSVEIAPPRHAGERTLRMRIRATCVVGLDLPPILFESELDPATQQFTVEDTSRG